MVCHYSSGALIISIKNVFFEFKILIVLCRKTIPEPWYHQQISVHSVTTALSHDDKYLLMTPGLLTGKLKASDLNGYDKMNNNYEDKT